LFIPGIGMKSFRYASPQTDQDPLFKTADNWIISECGLDGESKPTQIIIRSPEGKRYTLTRFHTMEKPLLENIEGKFGHTYALTRYDGSKMSLTDKPGNPAKASIRFFVTKIEDTNGNSINYHYDYNKAGRLPDLLLTRISASDGREVNLNYQQVTDYPQLVEGSSDPMDRRLWLLTSIEENNRTWRYEYEKVEHSRVVDLGSAFGVWTYPSIALKTVTGPENVTLWQYHNKFIANDRDNPFANYYLKGFTNVLGTRYSYEFSDEGLRVNYYLTPNPFGAYAVDKRVIEGSSLPRTEWNYTYSYRHQDPEIIGRYIVQTEIRGPGYTDVYEFVRHLKHDGRSVILTTRGLMRDGLPKLFSFGWDHGLMLSERRYSGHGTEKELLKSTRYEWDYQNFVDSRGWSEFLSTVPYYEDNNFFNRPLLTQKIITVENDRGGADDFTTVYHDYDEYGNAQRLVESGEKTRTTERRYFNHTGNWVIGLLEDEIIQGEGQIDRSFNENGKLASINDFGIAESYVYHADGNLQARQWLKDGGLLSHQYKDYKLGAAQQEIQADGVVIQRSINDRGLVDWEQDGLGNKTHYTYDDLDRLTSITPPENGGITIYYPSVLKKIVGRGGRTVAYFYDGMGRVIDEFTADGDAYKACFLSDTCSRAQWNETIIHVQKRYDSLGNQVFESRPVAKLYELYALSGSMTADQIPVLNNGFEYVYDVIGRLTFHKDTAIKDSAVRGSVHNFIYFSRNTGFASIGQVQGHGVMIADPFELHTIKEYESYGSPEEQYLIGEHEQLFHELDPRYNGLGDISTQITRNRMGDLVSVTKGGYTRSYALNAQRQVETQTDPETGITRFTYDEAGNLKTRITADGGITQYTYDGLNRISGIDYLGDTPDVFYEYDANSSLTEIRAGDVIREYTYNRNNVMNSESLSFRGEIYALNYGLDSLDQVKSITYPNGQRVLTPRNAFGQVTGVERYASGITYHPNGQIKSMRYHNGQRQQFELNNRHLISAIKSGRGTNMIVDMAYEYNNRRNLTKVSDRRNSGNDLMLRYDGSQRLETASGYWGKAVFNYSDTGNILSQQLGDNRLAYHYDDQHRLSSTSGRHNFDFTYDTRGNIRANGQNQFTFNGADNLVEVSGLVNRKYRYDGHHRRVHAEATGQSDLTFYGRNGQLMFRKNLLLLTNESSNYLYAGSHLIARHDQKNASPWIRITVPANSRLKADQPITFSAQAHDPEDGDISHKVIWESSRGVLGTGADITVTLTAGTFLLYPEVSDQEGSTAIAYKNLTITGPSRSCSAACHK